MSLLRLTVRVIMRVPWRRINYLRGKESHPTQLRQHCELQDDERHARRGDGEKPLRDSRNQIGAVHLCILRWLIEQTTECAAHRFTTNALFDGQLRRS